MSNPSAYISKYWPIVLLVLVGLGVEGSLVFLRLLTLAFVIAILVLLHRLIKEDKLLTGILFFLWAISLLTLSWGSIDGPDSEMWWQLSRGNTENLGWVLYRPKLYVWFLKIFSSPTWVPLGQWVLHGLLLTLMYVFIRKQNWHGGIKSGILLFFGLNSFWLQEKNHILDTTLFSLLGLACFYVCGLAMRSKKWVFIYGLLAGLSTLCRQLADPFLLLGFVFLWIHHIRHKKFVLASIVIFLVVGWIGVIPNYLNHSVAERTVALGVNLFTHSSYYNWDYPSASERELIGKVTNTELKPNPLWNSHYSSNISWFANALPHQYQRYLESEGMNRVESDKYLAGKYFQWVWNNPLLFIQSGINEFKRFLFKAEDYVPESLLSKWSTLPSLLLRVERSVIYFPIWWLCILSLVGIAYMSNHLRIGLGIALGYFLLLSFIHMGFTRYTLPILPILYLTAGQAFHQILTKTFRVRQSFAQRGETR